MRASTENLVGILEELGLLYLGGSPRGDGLGAEEQAFPYDFEAERRGEDLDLSPVRGDDVGLASAPPAPDAWARAAERRRVDLERIADAIGSGPPPELEHPDVFAWYQPIHYFGEAWGIYMREEGIALVAAALGGFVSTDRPRVVVAAECQRMAQVLLRLHEAFHHKVESAAIRLEIASQAHRYRPYDEGVYAPLLDEKSEHLLEEALGTAWMIEKRSSDVAGVGGDVVEGLGSFLQWWIPRLPAPYRRGIAIADARQFEELLFRLTGQIDEGIRLPARPDHQWTTFTHLHDPMHNRRSPHYIVVPSGEVTYLPHRGPMKHLALSARDVAKLLSKAGWTRSEGNRGRHPVKYVKEGQPPIPVPWHSGSLSPGTLQSIARAAGFSNARAMVAELR